MPGQLHRQPAELLLAGLVDVLQVVEEVVLAAEHLGALHAEELPPLGGGDVKGGPVDGQRGRAGEDGGAAVAAVDALHPGPIQVPGEGLQGRDVPVQRAVLSVQLGGREQEQGAAGVGDEEGGAGGGVVGAVAVRQLVPGEDDRRLEDQAALLAPVHFRAFRAFWLWLCFWLRFWLR